MKKKMYLVKLMISDAIERELYRKYKWCHNNYFALILANSLGESNDISARLESDVDELGKASESSCEVKHLEEKGYFIFWEV